MIQTAPPAPAAGDPGLTPLALENAALLRALAAQDFTTQAELADRLGRDKSNLHKTLKRLAAEGLVDGLKLTAAGVEAVRLLDLLSGVGSGGPEGPTTAGPAGISGFVELIWAQIEPDPLNPRKHFDAEAIEELADSILRDGLLENLVVRQGEVPEEPWLMRGDDPLPIHRLVAGERRHRAIKRLIERGDWLTGQPIPCRVVDLDDAGHRRVALVENLQRKDLRPIDEAVALKELMAVTGAGTAEVAKEIGFTQRFVQQRLQLLELPAAKQEALQKGELTVEAARTWLAARPDRLELAPEDELALLEIGWAIAAKPNTQWTTTPCDYTAPRALKDAGLLHFYDDFFTGAVSVRLESKAFGHLRAISGADDSLTRALLEPLLRKARVLAIGGSPLSADHDPQAFRKVDELFKSKKYVTAWLNTPHRPDPAKVEARQRRLAEQEQQNAEREAERDTRAAEAAAARLLQERRLERARAWAADVAAAEIPPDIVEIVSAEFPLPWTWVDEAAWGIGPQDAKGDWISLDDNNSPAALVITALLNAAAGFETAFIAKGAQNEDDDGEDDSTPEDEEADA